MSDRRILEKRKNERIEKKIERMYRNIDNILKQLNEIEEITPDKSAEIEDCRGAVDALANETEVLRRFFVKAG